MNNQGRDIEIPSRDEGKVVPLNVAVEIGMTWYIFHSVKHGM